MANTSTKYFTRDENVGVLSITTGQLDIAKIPVQNAPDWIVPKALILTIDAYSERIWTYLWQKQDVCVYHLLPKTATPTHLVVLESVTDIHSLALQIQGDVTFKSVRIADLKDLDDATYQELLSLQYPALAADTLLPSTDDQATPLEANTSKALVYQPVLLNDELCVVPDLDKLSHLLVDLDS